MVNKCEIDLKSREVRFNEDIQDAAKAIILAERAIDALQWYKNESLRRAESAYLKELYAKDETNDAKEEE